MKNCIISIDAGGTFFKYALVGMDGNMLTRVYKMPVNSGGSFEDVLTCYDKLIRHMKEESDKIQGIGISTPGPFDYVSGTSLMRHKFQALYKIPLKQHIRERFGSNIPIWFCSDTNAFLSGEHGYGAGMEYNDLLGITIGTGLGIAVISDGQILMNENKGPVEKLYNIPCGEGILEDYVSGRGIVEYYRRLSGDTTNLSAKDVGMRAAADLIAKQTFEDVGYMLGREMSEATRKYRAQAIVIGGQVANSFDYMKNGIERGLRENAIDLKKTVVLRAKELDEAALKGILKLREYYL